MMTKYLISSIRSFSLEVIQSFKVIEFVKKERNIFLFKDSFVRDGYLYYGYFIVSFNENGVDKDSVRYLCDTFDYLKESSFIFHIHSKNDNIYFFWV